MRREDSFVEVIPGKVIQGNGSGCRATPGNNGLSQLLFIPPVVTLACLPMVAKGDCKVPDGVLHRF